MKRLFPLYPAMACCTMLLAACGQKGPLFLPDEQRNVVVAPTTPAGATSPATAAPATPASATDAPAADGAATGAAAPATPADDATDPQSQRRSNTPPRTN